MKINTILYTSKWNPKTDCMTGIPNKREASNYCGDNL